MHKPYSARDHLPVELYRAEQVRQLDQVVIQQQGIPAFDLMERAGEAAFAALLGRWPQVNQICVLAGRGNNGGDAYVVAALAKHHGMQVCFYALGDHDQLSPESQQARTMAIDAGVDIQPWRGECSCDSDLFIDGLLGTGLSGDVSGDYLQAIETINRCNHASVLALDIPSGLCANTGRILGNAVKADMTISFIAVKQGMLTLDGPDYCGQLGFADLGTAKESRDQITDFKQRISWSLLNKNNQLLAPRSGNSHKGAHGHLLVVGGDYGTAGAVLMASQSALRSGAGLVTCLTQPEHVAASLAACPEVMVNGVQSGLELDKPVSMANVIVVGPGLGQRSWGQLLLQRLIVEAEQAQKPLVLDADALNLLGRFPQVRELTGAVIMTPHPGEAARLLNCSVADVQQDRYAAVHKLAQAYNAIVILKGQGTLISDGQQTFVCSDGNPGMATGGMGDILAGVIGALLAQGLDALSAAKLAVCAHSAAADIACEDGQIGLMATDLLPHIRRLVQQQ